MTTPLPEHPPDLPVPNPKEARSRSFFRRFLYRWVVRLGVLAALAYWLLPWSLPLPAELMSSLPESVVFLDSEGQPLRRPLWNGDFRHDSKPLAEIPRLLVNATLAAEDGRFYKHGGVDPLSLARVIRDRAGSNRFTSGASTITQQLIKITSPRGPRDMTRKLREILLARQLEMRWSKTQILEAYLNRLDYGNLTRGSAAAAQTYFQKPLSHLSIAECALLAGLPQGPSRLDPFRNPTAALKRRDWVLQRMVDLRYITPEARQQALAEPLKLKPLPKVETAGHALDLLTNPNLGSSTVPTTIQAAQQHTGERIIQQQLAKLQASGADIAALVVIEVSTGHVQVLVGSQDYAALPFNAAISRRSAGSTLKPFTYALALEKGYHSSSLLADVPAKYRSEVGIVEFNNYDRRHRGPVLFAEALACSLNLPALSLLNAIGGPEDLLQLLGRAGITSLEMPASHYGLGLTLGNAEVSLLELTNAYAMLARGGSWRPYQLVTNASSEEPRQVVSPEAAWIITSILADNSARSAAFGIQSVLRLPFPCAVKTGTSTDFRDNWCVGYSNSYAVGVWMGNSHGRPLQGVSGVAGAGPIFQEMMLDLHSQAPGAPFPRPATLVQEQVDTRTGKLATNALTPQRFRQPHWFRPGQLPTSMAAEDVDAQNLIILPANVYGEWYQGKENNLKHVYALASSGQEAAVVKITSPVAGTSYVLDPEVPKKGKTLKLQASLPTEDAVWTSPSLTIDGTTAQLELGRHLITVKSKSQPQLHAEVWITVEAGL